MFGQEIPDGASWRADPVAQMVTAAPDLRPVLLPDGALTDLHELRKFRHFFRDACVLDLDPARVGAHGERPARVAPSVHGSLEGFRLHRAAVLDELARAG